MNTTTVKLNKYFKFTYKCFAKAEKVNIFIYNSYNKTNLLQFYIETSRKITKKIKLYKFKIKQF